MGNVGQLIRDTWYLMILCLVVVRVASRRGSRQEAIDKTVKLHRNRTKASQKETQINQKATKRNPKYFKRDAREPKLDPNGAQREPEWSPNGAKGGHRDIVSSSGAQK